MNRAPSVIPAVQLIEPKRFGDARGWFTEIYSEPELAKLGIECRFVQDNHSLSVPAFTLRGLHFQTPPCGQAKLVRCLRGSIFDVAIDIRHGSPTYGQWLPSQARSALIALASLPTGGLCPPGEHARRVSVSRYSTLTFWLCWFPSFPGPLLVMRAQSPRIRSGHRKRDG
jgi:hypothetical protein